MATVHIDCPCVGTPHARGDDVTLRETLDFRQALGLRNAFLLARAEPDAGLPEAVAALSEAYIFAGIESWTLVDERGKPLPVSKAAIAATLLPHIDSATAVADAADELYQSTIVPLVRRASTSSPATPTEPPTSPVTDGSSSPSWPNPSSPSWTTTTPTDDTEETSALPVGVSS